KARNVHPVAEDKSKVVMVVLKESGQIDLGGDPIDGAHLRAGLAVRRHENPSAELQVKADRNVRYGEVRRIVRAARDAGFQGAVLVAEELKDGEAPRR